MVLPRVRRHRHSKPQGSSERVLPWQGHHGPINIRLSFAHPCTPLDSSYNHIFFIFAELLQARRAQSSQRGKIITREYFRADRYNNMRATWYVIPSTCHFSPRLMAIPSQESPPFSINLFLYGVLYDLSYSFKRGSTRLQLTVCVFFPFILDVKFVGCTSRGRTGGRSHGISHPPSFCGAWPDLSREKDSAVPFPRRP